MAGHVQIEFDVPTTMRDGIVLRANILRPAESGPFPVALLRTPYGKDMAAVSPVADALRTARAGYIVVVQDVRGRFGSGGEWTMPPVEAQDGYDTVEWAASLPGSNGAVGMFGASYSGFTQWAAAGTAPPHLRALVPTMAWADPHNGVFWRGGALELGLLGYWQLGNAFDRLLRRQDRPLLDQYMSVAALAQEFDDLPRKGYYELPVAEFPPLKRLDLTDELDALVQNINRRSFLAPLSALDCYDRVQAAVYNVSGWYDLFSQGTLDNFSAMQARRPGQVRLLMGPWAHSLTGSVVGDLDFGFASNMQFIELQSDLTRITLNWFDYWLKGIDNDMLQESPIKLFVMGDNYWRQEDEWPLARTCYTPYYIHSRGHANTLDGDGFLSTDPPEDEPADAYVYDPAQPVLTNGGAHLMNAVFHPGVADQRSTESRPDVLVFTSAPLEADLEVTGPLTVKLWASSAAPDTDFVARLVDVHPDGLAQNLADGIIRARFREGEEKLLEPGRVYEYTIDLWSTANVFKAGHRVRLDITSSNFPRWDRNPNTGGPFGRDTELRPARQTILHDAQHPSHILLPLIPR